MNHRLRVIFCGLILQVFTCATEETLQRPGSLPILDLPKILSPGKDSEGVKDPLLVILIGGVATDLNLQCEVQGVYDTIQWGRIREESPYTLEALESKWSEERGSASGEGTLEGSFATRTISPSGVIDAKEYEKASFRCLVTYKTFQVYSHIVSLDIIDVHQEPEAPQVPVIPEESNGYLFMPCVNSTDTGLAADPFKYLKYFDAKWSVESGRISTPIATDTNSVSSTHAQILYGGDLQFTFFRESDFQFITNRAPGQPVYYVCRLTPKPGVNRLFPLQPASRYRVDKSTISPRQPLPSLKLLRSSPQTVFTAEGDITRLFCLFGGGDDSPYPTLTWEFENEAGSEPPDLKASEAARRSNYTYVEFVAVVNYTGVVRCKAAGKTYRVFAYEVTGRILLDESSEIGDRVLQSGDGAEFKCKTSIDARIKWFYNGLSISSSDLNYNIGGTKDNLLQLIDLQPHQTGSLSCSSSNKAGQLYAQASLYVSHNPWIEQQLKASKNVSKTQPIILLKEDESAGLPVTLDLIAVWHTTVFFPSENETWLQRSFGDPKFVSSIRNETYFTVTSKHNSSTLSFTLSSEEDFITATGYYQFIVIIEGVTHKTDVLLVMSEHLLNGGSSDSMVVYLSIALFGISLVVLAMLIEPARRLFMAQPTEANVEHELPAADVDHDSLMATSEPYENFLSEDWQQRQATE